MIKAIFFDVFGTLVDWRTSIVELGMKILKNSESKIDWDKLAIEWRLKYQPSLLKINKNKWKNLDEIHRETLEKVLKEMKISFIKRVEKDKLIKCWHSLKAWNDSCKAIDNLNKSFITATLSNGHLALQKKLIKKNNFKIDFLFSAEHFKKYKPDKIVYVGAAKYLNLKPSECALVASHKSDLMAASSCGFRTIYISRKEEYGKSSKKFAKVNFKADISINSLNDLEKKLK